MERSRARAIYFARLNRVIDYVTRHLDEKLTLAVLAREATFSPWHFHRVFAGMVGESVHDLVRRLRLEQAAARLRSHPDDSVTAIARACGYSAPAAFIRDFKSQFGVSATAYRSEGKSRTLKGRPGHTPRTMDKAIAAPHGEVRQLPGCRVVYARHRGPCDDGEIGKVWAKLMKWAGSRGLLHDQPQLLGIAPDNPELTPAARCRYDACLVVGPGVKGTGGIGTAELPGGLYACAPFRGPAGQLGAAYQDLCGKWLPESGYQPADGPPLELYHGVGAAPDGRTLTCDICIPVKPL